MAIQFTTPVGRLVTGSFFDLQKQDHENKALPEERYHWFVGIAIPKTTAAWWDEPAPLFQAIRQAASSVYAEDVWKSPYFSSKIEDGDGKNKDRAGYAGNWIVKFTRNLFMGGTRVEPPRVGDSNYNPILDPMIAKRGYYYVLSGDCAANGKSGPQAGCFVNVSMALLVAKGEEIVTGPSLQQAFAGMQFQLPPGAAPVGMGQPQPQQPAPQAAAPAAAPTAPAAPAAPLAPRMTPVSAEAKANPDTNSAFWRTNGWTDDLLVQHGHFTRAM